MGPIGRGGGLQGDFFEPGRIQGTDAGQAGRGRGYDRGHFLAHQDLGVRLAGGKNGKRRCWRVWQIRLVLPMPTTTFIGALCCSGPSLTVLDPGHDFEKLRLAAFDAGRGPRRR
ncbi:MAG: hypothetical protein WDN04_22725 [Rhodospirillales bacterium]